MRTIGLSGILCALVLGAAPPRLHAQATPPPVPPRPAYQTLRFEEDWSFLRDSSRRSDPWDRFKYVRLGENDNWYVSFGGETRFRYEAFHNSNFGGDPVHFNGYLLQRHMVHADLHLGTHLRFFNQLASALESGSAHAPRSIDEDQLELHQTFLELRFGFAKKSSWFLRLGRQEIDLGSSRLVATREPQNVRQRFDGVRFEMLTRNNTWRIGALATKPVIPKSGIMDDVPDHATTFTGAYLILPNPVVRGGNWSFYWAGFAKKQATYVQGTAREFRDTLGTRWFGTRKALDYNEEFIFQAGTFGKGDIRAWTIATDTGYSFPKAPLRPRFGIGFDISSGDKNRNDPNLQTFNALFNNSAYSDKVGLVGPANGINLNPTAKLKIGKLTPSIERVTLLLEWNSFWRTRITDGAYLASGSVLRTGIGNNARFVATQPTAQVVYRFDTHLDVTAIYTHVFPGQFLKNTPPAKDLDYVTTYVTYRF